MDKQQLAQRIWESANNLRGSIEAYEYKDYILGLLFYKYLSDQQYEQLKGMKMTDEEIYSLTEDNVYIKEYCQENLGYFIEPKAFFRYWIENIGDFREDDLSVALHAYERNLSEAPDKKQVFSGIFDTITRNLTSLASTSSARTIALRDLMEILKDVPTTHSEYDVLGFIYEYLISRFAAGAGKKSGEYYTPKEASDVIARICAIHLYDKKNITALDPTAGSGSLLLAVGHEFERAKHQQGRVKYYFQDKVKVAYDTCRQNLLMRGVEASNMTGRNGDTLDLDYPYFSDKDPEGTYEPIFVDAVVSNPPYSQNYEPEKLRGDVRFNEYGLPPKSKADYAFMLHCLYHLKSDGVGAIVLPHGVLFRGSREGEIRERLVKKNYIDTIIGLAPNMFFGTGIPVTIIIFRKNKADDNILFIDASDHFTKVGNKNKLRESDIQKIVDAYRQREDIPNFARLVSQEEIEKNEYNLNITRYVNASPEAERYDPYAVMQGVLPKEELREKFANYWQEFPSLKDDLFEEVNEGYVRLKTDHIIDTIRENAQMQSYKDDYHNIIAAFAEKLRTYLLPAVASVDLSDARDEVKDMLFRTLEDVSLIDRYDAYQKFSEIWEGIELNIEEIQQHGLSAAKEVKEEYVFKKVNKVNTEVFDRYEGRILPLSLIQEHKLKDKKERFDALTERTAEIQSELQELIELIDEEDKDKVLNDNEDAFMVKKVEETLSTLFDEVDSEEIETLKAYMDLLDNRARKPEKITFMEENTDVNWDAIDKNKDGTVGKGGLNKYVAKLQAEYEYEEDSLGYILSKAQALREEENEAKNEIRTLEEELIDKSIEALQNLTDDEVITLLAIHWVKPVEDGLNALLPASLQTFEKEINDTIKKYGNSMESIEKEINQVSQDLAAQLGQLTGSKQDMDSIQSFIELLGGIDQ